MGVVKEHSARREPVNVRRLCLGVPTHATDPVIEVIDGDEQDIGFGCISRLAGRLSSEGNRAEADKDESQLSFFHTHKNLLRVQLDKTYGSSKLAASPQNLEC